MEPESSAVPAAAPRSIGVLGGGTAGYFAALAIKRRFPDRAVTVVDSKDVPIIGVGEATTTLMPPFLHAQLGLDVVELFRAVRPTFKLGIKFEWGLPEPGYCFTYPFGDADPIEAVAFDGDLRGQSLLSLMMGADRVPVLRGPNGEIESLLPQVKWAYHLDNAPFVSFLAQAAARAGIRHEVMTVSAVVPRPDGAGVAALRDDAGRELRFDLYVDATGFRSRLLGQALAVPFVSFAGSLFCDRAAVADVPRRGPSQPYTTAETMDCGWCWRIPVEDEDHRGYVFSSAHVSDDAAVAEMRARNPGMREPTIVRFRSGRHRDFWRGNVVALGNAYGFVEPLESTALHMVIVEIAYLLAGLAALERPDDGASYAAFASEAVGAHWDYLRWFLALHYRFNRRAESPFWRAARAEVDISGLEAMVARYQQQGPWLVADGQEFQHGDPAFGFSGAMMLLLGQRVPGPVRPRAGITRAEWDARVARQRVAVRWALAQDDALAVLRERPEVLRDAATSPRSWCVRDAERVAVLPTRQWVHPRSGMPAADPALRGALR
jgi:tryptophan halogenase